jgi:citrate lyase gamma subunit
MKFHDNIEIEVKSMKAKKFATQIDEKVLKDLKTYVSQTDRSISSVVSEAVAEYIQRARLRPAFKNAMNEVLEEHSELLKRLAK